MKQEAEEKRKREEAEANKEKKYADFNRLFRKE